MHASQSEEAERTRRVASFPGFIEERSIGTRLLDMKGIDVFPTFDDNPIDISGHQQHEHTALLRFQCGRGSLPVH